MEPAREILEKHAAAINRRDTTAYCQTINFPFTYQNYDGVALTVNKAEDYGVTEDFPWDIILRAEPHWHHTAFDAVEEVARSAFSAVFKVSFRRVDVSGRDSGTSQAIWIVTCQQGHWGVQFRHNLGKRDDSQ